MSKISTGATIVLSVFTIVTAIAVTVGIPAAKNIEVLAWTADDPNVAYSYRATNAPLYYQTAGVKVIVNAGGAMIRGGSMVMASSTARNPVVVTSFEGNLNKASTGYYETVTCIQRDNTWTLFTVSEYYKIVRSRLKYAQVVQNGYNGHAVEQLKCDATLK
jgi:hypothetical protein